MMKRSNRMLLAVLCMLLVIGPASLFAGKRVSAQIMRIAVVQSLQGEVNVLKAGGKKPFLAFKNMSLNEGDQIATGKNGGAVLELSSEAADKDSVTIGPNSVVNFTKMKDSGGTKTKMSVWAGSLWVKVKSVSNASDQFEVETPTSIMGVRGTQFYIGVDPATGLTNVFLAAGVIQALTGESRFDAGDNKQLNKLITIYPSQSITETGTNAGVATEVSVVDIASFIANASSDIILAILKDAASIAEEQRQMMDNVKQALDSGAATGAFGGMITSQSDFDRISNNLNQLVSLIAQQALKANKLDSTQLQAIIDEVNKQAKGKLIDLSTTSTLQLTDAEKKKQLEAEALRKKQEALAAQQKAADEQKKKLQEALQALQKAKELQEQNRKKLEEEQQKAAQKLFDSMTAEQQRAFNESRKANGLKELNSTNSNTTSPPVTVSAKATLAYSDPNLTGTQLSVPQYGKQVDFNVVFNGFQSSQAIMGYQIEIEYDPALAMFDSDKFTSPEFLVPYRGGGATGFKVEPEGATVVAANSVDDFRVLQDGNLSKLVYTVAKFSGDATAVSDGSMMVKLPFFVHPFTTEPIGTVKQVPFTITSIKAVDASGNTVAMVSGNPFTIQAKLEVSPP